MSWMAQLPDVSLLSEMAKFGLLGVVLGWFMFKFDRTTRETAREIVQEIRTLAHRIDGMTRAMLVDVISRDNCGPHAKQEAQKMLANIESRNGRT